MSNYVILGIKPGASIIEIKSRYRVLCKEYHPDKTGGDKIKTAKFITIKDAYEALLKGDSGSNTTYNKQTKDSNFREEKSKKTGSYKFISIKKSNKNYLVRFDVSGISYITIRGKNGRKIGYYNTIKSEGIVDLLVSFEAAKKGAYVFKCKLVDNRDYFAEVTYKVKPPNFMEKLKLFLSDYF